MAYDKEITIKVKEEGVDELNTKVTKLNKSLDQVETESKKAGEGIEEVTKNGGAIAILDQFTGGLATRFRDAFEATKLFNFSLKGTKTALIATGIGAFVVLLGVVIAYWDDIVGAITGANKALEIQNELIDSNVSNLDREYKILEEKEKLLKAEGKSVKGVREEKEKLLKLQIEENTNLLSNLKLQLKKEQSTQRELGFWEAIKLKASQQFLGNEAYTNALSKLVTERQKALDEIDAQIDEAEARAFSLQTTLAELNKPEETEKEAEKERKKVVGVDGNRQGVQGIEEDPEIINARIKADTLAILDKQYQDRIAEYRKQVRKDDLEELERLEQTKTNIRLKALNDLTQIAGAETKVGKTLLVAKQLLLARELVLEASKTITFSAQAAARSVVAVAEGTAQTAKIGFPQNIPMLIGYAAQAAGILSAIKGASKAAGASSSIGGGSSVSIPQVTTAPSFNLVQGTGSNQIAEGLQSQSQPIEAYVVSSNVTTSQELDRKIVDGASLG